MYMYMYVCNINQYHKFMNHLNFVWMDPVKQIAQLNVHCINLPDEIHFETFNFF